MNVEIITNNKSEDASDAMYTSKGSLLIADMLICIYKYMSAFALVRISTYVLLNV